MHTYQLLHLSCLLVNTFQKQLPITQPLKTQSNASGWSAIRLESNVQLLHPLDT